LNGGLFLAVKRLVVCLTQPVSTGDAFFATGFGDAFFATGFGDAFFATGFGDAFFATGFGDAFFTETGYHLHDPVEISVEMYFDPSLPTRVCALHSPALYGGLFLDVYRFVFCSTQLIY
jgi:hypothetical protein